MKIFFIVPFLLLSFAVSAQIVHIPDPAFKNALLDHWINGGVLIDTNGDGEIQVSEAEAITGILDVNGQFIDIHDLTGIEAFINITELHVWQNQLTTLDLSQNTKLEYLDCWNNPLTSLNITNCTSLQILYSSHTLLSNIDLKTNPDLREVSIHNNQLINLDIRNGNNTNITVFDSRNNPNLTCIFVDNKGYSENSPVWFKDSTSTYVETQQQCDALGSNDFFLRNIKIHPNPLKNTLNIELPEHSFQGLWVEVVDIVGKKVFTYDIKHMDLIIDVSFLQTGIYFLNIHNNKTKLLTKKLVKL